MNPYRYQIRIRKEALKFSAAHFTLFPDGNHERLHGHNYATEVSIQVKDIGFEKFLPFSQIKQALKKICEDWDERVLIPSQNPLLQFKTPHPTEVEFSIGTKRYVFPQEDVILLNLDNITSETLASEGCKRLVTSLKGQPGFELISSLEFRVEESPGQGASCEWRA